VGEKKGAGCRFKHVAVFAHCASDTTRKVGGFYNGGSDAAAAEFDRGEKPGEAPADDDDVAGNPAN